MWGKKVLLAVITVFLVVLLTTPVLAAAQLTGSGAGTLLESGSAGQPFATFTGSGFFIAPDVVVTSQHVIRQASRIEIIYNNEIQLAAEVLASDEATDLALLKVHGLENAVTPLTLANANTVRQGSRVYAVGFPLPLIMGMQAKLSEGIISSMSGLQGDLKMIQISTPLQPGNSGGPLLNERAEVVGVVAGGLNAAALLQEGIMPQNVNYAVKINNIYNLAAFCGLEVTQGQAEGGTAMSAPDVMDVARQAVVFIMVLK